MRANTSPGRSRPTSAGPAALCVLPARLEMIPNTAPFDVTGHPAATVPCQPPGSLPVGMTLVGRHYADTQVLQVAAACEEVAGGFV